MLFRFIRITVTKQYVQQVKEAQKRKKMSCKWIN
jgi:hypothetical protein